MKHAPTTAASGTSTRMPIEPFEIGKYVIGKRRADGTVRLLFQVPERLRPPGWSPTIALPVDPPRTGNMSDWAEMDRAKADALGLYQKLRARRYGTPEKPPARSLAMLVEAWRASEAWRNLRPRSRKGYEDSIGPILTWSALTRHPDPTKITQADVEKYLALYNDRPRTKQEMKKVFRLIMRQAIAKGWRHDNPAAGIQVKVVPKKAVIWEQKDVDLYVEIARSHGMHSIALIILLEWEIGQRLTDVRSFRPGAEYDKARGVFSFDQSKTGAPVDIEISPALRDMLAEKADGELFLFRNERTGKAYEEKRLSHTFGWVRKAVVEQHGGRRLILRQLRHSCVVQLARAGCTIPEICAVTGHALASAEKILQTYLPRDSSVARAAQVKRGLVAEREAG